MDDDVRLSAAEALQLISPYFAKEWPATKVEDVRVRRVSGGFMNQLHLVSRTTNAKEEPASVLVRHFGSDGDIEDPPESTTTLSAAEQAVIYYEMGRRGWGPKIYGLFKGGRLEEYIDSRPLTAAEASNPNIRRDLARSYARLHSLQLPLRKGNFNLMVEDMKHSIQKKDEIRQNILSIKDPGAPTLAAVICDNDWVTELDWVSTLFRKHDCRPAIAIGDANFLNVLVKDYDSECRTMLIDYETATYGYRGIDIGGHFNERMYAWSQPGTKFTGLSAPDGEEQRLFCEDYVREVRELGCPDDSVDQVLLEAQIGRMWQLLFSVLMAAPFEGMPDDDEGLFEGLVHMLATYYELKDEWMDSV